MSYRAFKRLLGETSLERKCRFLFGGFILLLITASFWWYARQTQHLAYDQIPTTCRLIVTRIVDKVLATKCRPAAGATKTARLLEEFSDRWEKDWPGELHPPFRILVPDSPKIENKPPETYSSERLAEFLADRDMNEHRQPALSQSRYYYYGAVRASQSCLGCHRALRAERRGAAEEAPPPGGGGAPAQPAEEDLKEGSLLAVVKIEYPTTGIEEGVNYNNGWLLATAVFDISCIMFGLWGIVRYVIVKPVKHLKEVADAISAGELNVRSEIQTADEFEDLSHAFNRMLRNLVSMQDRLRKVNADLDRKVDELAQANLALYESNRLKGDFLATMSHELRTPLNSILGFSEVLGSGTGLSEKQLRWVTNIRTSGQQLLNLINDILDLAKIESGKMELRLAEFSVYDVCEGLLTMFRPLAEKKNIDLRASLAPGIPLLRQDVVKLQQILSNLLSNAVKFTPEGGRVQLKVEAEGDSVEVTVSDTGVGIARDEQELVFEKFRQAGNPLTREHAGTGLGLSIVREMAKLLGGEVSLQSELGRGSTFTVRLPLRRGDEPRLEFDLAHEGVDLSKAQRVDARVYAGVLGDESTFSASNKAAVVPPLENGKDPGS